jgi:hypothetical protein
MDIDWRAPKHLRSPKRDPSTLNEREKLARAKLKRRKHKPGKAHATNQERSKVEAAKAQRAADRRAKRDAKFDAYITRVKAYWRGELDEHPEKPL